ncbi:unnamed protein product [Caenorhabditis nigoni]
MEFAKGVPETGSWSIILLPTVRLHRLLGNHYDLLEVINRWVLWASEVFCPANLNCRSSRQTLLARSYPPPSSPPRLDPSTIQGLSRQCSVDEPAGSRLQENESAKESPEKVNNWEEHGNHWNVSFVDRKHSDSRSSKGSGEDELDVDGEWRTRTS